MSRGELRFRCRLIMMKPAKLVAAAVISLVGLLSVSPARAQGEIDMFAWLVGKLGEPELAHKVPDAEVASYADAVPEALLRFWSEHGRGSYMKGAFWICDPRPFGPVLRDIFAGDSEFDPSQMTWWVIPRLGQSSFGIA